MIRAISSLLAVTLVAALTQNTPRSPCPNVFNYEATTTEPGQWYGVVNLSTDSTLHSLWLNIVLDSKAEILGNWIGNVTTTDNIDFNIENTKMKIPPGPATAVRFFIKHNPLTKAPKLQAIRLNGREICNANIPTPAIDLPDNEINHNQDTNARPRPDAYATKPTPSARPIDNIIIRPTESITSRPVETKPIDTVLRPYDTTNTRPIERPVQNTRPEVIRPVDTKPLRPDNTFETKPSKGRPTGEGPVYVPTPHPPIDQTNVNPYSIGGGQPSVQNSVGLPIRPDYVLTTAPPKPYTRPVQDEDYGDSKPDPDDYFSGLRPVIPAVKKPQESTRLNECGTVVRNNPNPLVVNGKPTLEGQWPWQIALYQARGVDIKYICGGTLVSDRHIVTAAHCVTLKSSNRVVNKNTLTVYLGKHNLRTSIEGVQNRYVNEIIVHPQYNATSFSKDISVLNLMEPVQFTDWVRPACLWPDNFVELSNVIGKKGSVVGWGFDDTGVATEELSLVEMPVVDQETCIRSYSDFFVRFTSEYTYCAGYRDGVYNNQTGTLQSSSVCNGDSGGGMVFSLQNRWYLRGLVSLSVARQTDRCDPNHYVVFTDVAKFLPWLKEIISNS